MKCRKIVEEKTFWKKVSDMFSANDVKERITNLRLRVIMLQNQFLVGPSNDNCTRSSTYHPLRFVITWIRGWDKLDPWLAGNVR